MVLGFAFLLVIMLIYFDDVRESPFFVKTENFRVFDIKRVFQIQKTLDNPSGEKKSVAFR